MTLPPCTVCQSPAAWNCTACGTMCAEHVKRVKGPRQRFRCDSCGKDAELLRRRRAELTDFRSRVKPSLVILGRPLLALLASAFAVWAGSLLGAFGVFVTAPLALALGLKYLRTVADGAEFSWPSGAEAKEELGIPLARAAAAILVPLVLVVAVFRVVVVRWRLEVDHVHSLTVTLLLEPLFWVAVLVSLAYVPMALLGSTLASTWISALNPMPVVAAVRKWPRYYGYVSAFAGGGFLLVFLLRWLLSSGFVPTLFISIVATYAFFATMRLLGEWLHLHPEDFGWGRIDESVVELGDPEAPALFDPATAPEPSAELHSTLEGQVNAALDARDAKLVVRLYESSPGADRALEPPTLLRVGQAAASVDEYSTALSALTAAGRSETADAAKALVIAGRILDERLREYAGAKRLFEQVVVRFPQTQAAEFARRQLADHRFLAVRGSG